MTVSETAAIDKIPVRMLVVAVSAVVAVLLAAACGGGGGESAQAPTGGDETAKAEEADGSSAPSGSSGSSGEFVNVDEMKAARQLHAAVKLPDGRVFVVGGRGPGANLNNTVYESAEIYDPAADEWTLTGMMQDQRHDLCGALLADGRVLAAGGRGKLNFALGTAEVWNPESSTWSQTANMAMERDYMPCVTLDDGRVLAVGGEGKEYQLLDTAEIWDPATGEWMGTPPMSATRARHTANRTRRWPRVGNGWWKGRPALREVG